MKQELERRLKSAVAIVHFTGMGITCFNSEEGLSETFFIHTQTGDEKKDHNLELTIFRPASKKELKEPENEPYFDSLPIFLKNKYDLLDDQQNHADVKVEISTFGSDLASFKLHTSNNFSRQDKNADENDIKWTIDLLEENLVGSENTEPIKNNNYPTTQLLMKNCYIYTELLAKADKQKGKKDLQYFKILDKGNEKLSKSKELNPTPFGRVAEKIGAIFNGKVVSLKISFGTSHYEFWLSKQSKPYYIVINNSAEEAENDIETYREFWTQDGNTKYDLITTERLKAIKEELGEATEDSGSPIGVVRVCTPTTAIKVPTIKMFLPDELKKEN